MLKTPVPEGRVGVEDDKGWLRLRWTYKGQRYNLALGYPDSPTNWDRAEGEAARVQGNIQTDNFDLVLRKHRPEEAMAKCELRATEFGEFTQHKSYKGYFCECVCPVVLQALGEKNLQLCQTTPAGSTVLALFGSRRCPQNRKISRA